ncbi:MAG: hypothetical protein ACYC6Y_30975, partial [Thermoguttaceae bacterium]
MRPFYTLPTWAAALFLAASAGAAEVAQGDLEVLTDSHGAIVGLQVSGEDLPLHVDLRLPAKGWNRIGRFNPARPAVASTEGNKTTWESVIQLDDGKACRYRITQERAGRSIVLDLNVVAEADLDVEGVYLWAGLPIRQFLGGKASLSADDGRETIADCPTTLAEKYTFLGGRASRVRMADAAGLTSVEFQLDRPIHVGVQDDRKFNGSDYSFLFQVSPGP